MSNSLSTALKKGQPKPIPGGQDIVLPGTSINDLYTHLAKEQITPDANSGKQIFYAIVTNVIDNPGIKTDPFLSKQYEIARTNGLSDKEASSAKAVFVHVPALYTFYYDAYDKEATKEKKVTQFDLQKLVVFTDKSIAIGNVITITFENLKDYTGPIFLNISKEKNEQLVEDRKKFQSSKELFSQILQCKILAAEEAEGYAAFSNTAAKQKPRRGYWSFYKDFVNQISTENLVNKIIVSNTTNQLKNLGIVGSDGIVGTDSATQKANALTIFKGITHTIKARQQVYDYINIQSTLESSEELPKLNLDTEASDSNAVYWSVNLTGNEALKNEIINIIQAIVEDYYGFNFALEGEFYKMNPFPNDGIEEAIKKSKALDNLAAKNSESAEQTTTESPREKTPLTDSQKNQPVPKTKLKENVPQCEDQTKINNQIYIKASESKSFDSDNKRITKIFNKALSGWHSSIEIETILLYDYEQQKNLPTSGEFIYGADQAEIISPVKEEDVKPPKQQTKDNPKGTKKEEKKPKSTSPKKIIENNQKLSQFVTAFTKFIAINEEIDQKRVFLIPLSVFRPFKKEKPGQGQDQNSRHFFNRAIDFVVYLVPESYDSKSKQLPSEGTFEIPNYIVYCYLLKFIKQQPSFAQCGIGLLEKGKTRDTGYVHYEWMGELDQSQRNLVQLNRRWVSKPKEKNSNSLYGQASGRPDKDKDAIIKNWVIKDVKAKIGILPTKLENLL